jgi:CheY-like chemotaxis protein
MCDALKTAGYVTLEAGDGAEALRLLLGEAVPKPLVIVLDLELPLLPGPELLRLLKGYQRLSCIPVIVTSAGAPPVRSELDVGWLPQPFDAERLVTLVIERCTRSESSTDAEKAAS